MNMQEASRVILGLRAAGWDEKDINDFISEMTGEVIDIKYQVSIGVFSEEQIFCFSAMIVYTE